MAPPRRRKSQPQPGKRDPLAELRAIQAELARRDALEKPFTLERVLTDPDLFGLTTATPIQRAICRIADGLPLEELAEHPDVTKALGDVSLLQTGIRPLEIIVLSGIRGGKSLLAAALAVRSSQTCDLSMLRPGEVARVSILSLTKDVADVVFNHLTGHILASPALRGLMVGDPSVDTVVLKHPSGKLVEVTVVAGARAGGSLVARWSAGAIFDEAPRMLGEEDGVINYDDARTAVLGRLLPGAQLIALGSPWAPRGPIYEAVQKSWGKPTNKLVVIRSNGPAMNPTWWTPERVDSFRTNPEIGYEHVYQTDVLGEFVDPVSGFFDSASINACIDDKLVMPRIAKPGEEVTAGGDLGFIHDSSALCVVHRNATMFYVADLLELRPEVNKPLKTTEVLDAFAKRLLTHAGLEYLVADATYRQLVVEYMAERGIALKKAPTGTKGITETFLKTRKLMREGLLKIPRHERLLQQLHAVRARPTQTGDLQIILPRDKTGHCDIVSALVLAVWEACGIVVPEPGPEPGTKEYYDKEGEDLWAKAEQDLSERQQQEWWERLG